MGKSWKDDNWHDPDEVVAKSDKEWRKKRHKREVVEPSPNDQQELSGGFLYK